MLRTLFVALALASVSVAAHADMRTVVKAYEVGVNDFRAPGTANGTLAMRACPDCKFQTLRVTSATRYQLNGAPVEFVEFLDALKLNQNRDKSIIIVKHDIDEDVVTAVSVNLK
jgi:hypothetical protein